jgi:hypothetical protein
MKQVSIPHRGKGPMSSNDLLTEAPPAAKPAPAPGARKAEWALICTLGGVLVAPAFIAAIVLAGFALSENRAEPTPRVRRQAILSIALSVLVILAVGYYVLSGGVGA